MLNKAREEHKVPERSTSIIIMLTDGDANVGEAGGCSSEPKPACCKILGGSPHSPPWGLVNSSRAQPLPTNGHPCPKHQLGPCRCQISPNRADPASCWGWGWGVNTPFSCR